MSLSVWSKLRLSRERERGGLFSAKELALPSNAASLPGTFPIDIDADEFFDAL